MYNTDAERARWATSLQAFLKELMKAGFEREEALAIVVAYAHGTASKQSA